MLEVNNRKINASILSILETLLKELQDRGINLLRVLKVNGNNIQTCCPYHNNGKEVRPSSGITIENTYSTKSGTFHCFACGKVATLPELISHCFGHEGSNFGVTWILERFNSTITFSREVELVNTLGNFFQPRTQGLQEYVSEEELDKYRYTHTYMYKRKLTDEIIELFDVGFDKTTNCITFPCYDLDHNCVFVARRSVVGKFFNYPREVDKPVYGLEKINKNESPIYVCESIINALTLWTWGYKAVALLGTGSSKQYEILRNFPTRKYILCFDGDTAGYKATRRFKENVKNKIVEWCEIPRNKDVNDLTYEQFKNLKMRGI